MLPTSLQRRSAATALALLSTLSLVPLCAWSAGLPPDVQAKVEATKKRLTEMAADPVVIATAREANAHEATGMDNGKWLDLPATDPAIANLLNSKASKLIAKWEKDDAVINKIVLRDKKGLFTAGSTKPLIYNNSARPVFFNAIKGQPWAADEVKPDTTTQIPSVHVAVPVLDGGKPIGVLHAGVSAN